MPARNQGFVTKVVYSRTNKVHLILRIVPIERLRWSWDDQTDRVFEYFNSLVSTRSLDGLLKAIEKLPPIIPSRQLGSMKVVYEKNELSSGFFSSLLPCRSPQLKDESYLDSCRPIRSNASRVDSFIKSWGSCGDDFRGLAEAALDAGNVILVEPLQDWTFLRNSLSICARLIVECSSSSPSLKRCGFFEAYSNRLRKSLLCIPIKYNTFFANPISLDATKTAPFYYALTKAASQKTNIPMAEVDIHTLDPSNETVFITTKPTAIGKTEVQDKSAKEEKVLLLCVQDNGDNGDMARAIVSSFSRAFRHLSIPLGKKGENGKLNCGWSYDENGEFEELDGPRLCPQSLASSLWYRLAYHPEENLSRCKWCEGALLSKKIGATREFCSGSCRVQFGRKYPGGKTV